MDPKLLTENGWKTVAQKSKVKDCGLQPALPACETLHEDRHAEKLKAIGAVIQFVTAQKKARDAAAVVEAVKYLTKVLVAAQAEQRELTRDKTAAGKADAAAAKADAANQKKAEAEAKLREQEKEKQSAQTEEVRLRLVTTIVTAQTSIITR